jgi:hypothetical protein
MFWNNSRTSPSSSFPNPYLLSFIFIWTFIGRYVKDAVETTSLIDLGSKKLIERNRSSVTGNVRDGWQEHRCRPVRNTPRPFLINEIFWLHAGRAVTPVAGMTLHHAVPKQALCLGRFVLTLQIHKNCTTGQRILGASKALFHFYSINYDPRL